MVVLLILLAWFSYWIGYGVFAPVLVFVGAVIIYVVGALCVILLLGAYAGVANYLGERLFRRRMRIAGRFIPEREVVERLERSPGTLIVERPTIGWNITRAWWTPDDVVALAPAPPGRTDGDAVDALCRDPFTHWAYERYTHPETGKATLVAAYSGKRVVDRITAAHPSLRHVELMSGFVIQQAVIDAPMAGRAG